MNATYVEIIADSINSKTGDRITTFLLTFPRIILAEFNTHRMLSRNSASSRAIPYKKFRRRVLKNPFIPINWMRDHKGMQGDRWINNQIVRFLLRFLWLRARDSMLILSYFLNKLGLTKQICNRLLEPWMYHVCIVTATEWENFFALRANEAAEIHIQSLAYRMLFKYNDSDPKVLEPGEWHIPFGEKFDIDRLRQLTTRLELDKQGKPDIAETYTRYPYGEELNLNKIKIATARCARTSYINFEGKDNYFSDVKLHKNLVEMGHWSPFEHCAQAVKEFVFIGNFKGWKQYRKFFSTENLKDPRVKHIVTTK